MAERLERHGSGYRLTLEPGELDVDAGRRVAVDDPGAALALWRGPALEEFDWLPALEAESVGLDELRLRLVDDDLDHRLGRGEDVTVEAAAAAAASPLRERTTLLHLRALAAEGRTAEAMEAARAFRRRLAEETGLEPTAALAELEHLVAAGSVERPSSVVRRVARPGGPLVGRQHERQEVVCLLGRQALVTVTGPVVSARRPSPWTLRPMPTRLCSCLWRWSIARSACARRWPRPWDSARRASTTSSPGSTGLWTSRLGSRVRMQHGSGRCARRSPRRTGCSRRTSSGSCAPSRRSWVEWTSRPSRTSRPNSSTTRSTCSMDWSTRRCWWRMRRAAATGSCSPCAFLLEETQRLGEAAETTARFVSRCRVVAEEIGTRMFGPGEAVVDRRLRDELDNLRAARDLAAFDDRVAITLDVSQAATWRDLREPWLWALELVDDPRAADHPGRGSLLAGPRRRPG